MRWLPTLLLCGGCATANMDVHRGGDSADTGIDGSNGGCLTDSDPMLQLGTMGPAFQSWQESDALLIEVGSEGGLSLPFAVASQNTPRDASLSAQFSLQDDASTLLAAVTDVAITLSCNADSQLVSEPQRLTVSWEGDSMDLFAEPARLNVSVSFSSGEMLSAEKTAEITF